MKRALTAMICGGLLVFVVPQAASAEQRGAHSAQPAAPSDGKGHDEASKPAAEDSGQPKQDAPGEGRSHYDKLHHDGDTF